MIFEPVDGGLRLTIDNHSRDVVAHLLGELRHEVEVAKTTTPAALEPHMKRLFPTAVSYTHLTLPTNREV